MKLILRPHAPPKEHRLLADLKSLNRQQFLVLRLFLNIYSSKAISYIMKWHLNSPRL